MCCSDEIPPGSALVKIEGFNFFVEEPRRREFTVCNSDLAKSHTKVRENSTTLVKYEKKNCRNPLSGKITEWNIREHGRDALEEIEGDNTFTAEKIGRRSIHSGESRELQLKAYPLCHINNSQPHNKLLGIFNRLPLQDKVRETQLAP